MCGALCGHQKTRSVLVQLGDPWKHAEGKEPVTKVACPAEADPHRQEVSGPGWGGRRRRVAEGALGVTKCSEVDCSDGHATMKILEITECYVLDSWTAWSGDVSQ